MWEGVQKRTLNLSALYLALQPRSLLKRTLLEGIFAESLLLFAESFTWGGVILCPVTTVWTGRKQFGLCSPYGAWFFFFFLVR